MTAAQQDAAADPRDLTDAAAAREKAKAFIEQYLRINNSLPSGELVGKQFGMSDKWGRNQLKPFRADDDTSPTGTLPVGRNGRVRDLVAERAAAAGTPAGTSATIVPAAPERPEPVPAARPERTAERSTPPTPAAPERSGAPTSTSAGTTAARSGTPDAASDGPAEATWWDSDWCRSVREHWFLYLIGAAAFVAIWGGWVGLGKLTGFGEIELLPGAGWSVIDTAVTLPLGVEAYAAYALKVAIAPPPGLSSFGRGFAWWSAGSALVLGAAGQVAYHLMVEAGQTTAPWQITTFVSCLPVAVMGAAAVLHHLVKATKRAA